MSTYSIDDDAAIANICSHLTRLGPTPVIEAMRLTGRIELIHYAGAAHRDDVALHMCAQYLADPDADEATLKARALESSGFNARFGVGR